jgi:hypothetical protein
VQGHGLCGLIERLQRALQRLFDGGAGRPLIVGTTVIAASSVSVEVDPTKPSRRTIYAMIERARPLALLKTFDVADPEQHSPQRYQTTVPQQGLFLLNSPFIGEMAQSVAARILYGTGRLTAFARMCLVEAGANLVLSILLCREFGLIGLVWGIAIPNLLMNLWTIGEARRSTELAWGTYLRLGWLGPLTAAWTPVVVWWLLAARVDSWFSLVATGVSGLVPYAVVILMIERGPGWLAGRFRPQAGPVKIG